MKIILAGLAVFALLLGGIMIAGGSTHSADALLGPTRAPSGPPNCAPGQDSGDDGDDFTGNADDPEDGYDNPDSDDPSSATPNSGAVLQDDGGRNWDGFDHDIEVPDDCVGPTVTELPVSQTPVPSPTFCFDGGGPNTQGDPCCLSADLSAGVCNVQTEAADANCDGNVSVGDALAVVLYISGSEAGCTGGQLDGGIAGDANCSGQVNAVDATLILRQSAGLASAGC